MMTMILAFTWLEGIYLFCFIVGLLFVFVTAVMGFISGFGDADADVDVDVDVDADVDIDMDVDADGDVDISHEADPGDSISHEAHGGHHAEGEHPGDFHAGHGEVVGGYQLGVLSPMILSAIVFSFGGVGMMLTYSGAMKQPPWLYVSILPSGVSAFVFAWAVMWGFNKLFRRIESSSDVRVRALIGATGTVITPIPANGLGEIKVIARGASWTSAARSANGEAIGKYEKIVIKEKRRHVCLVLPVAKKAKP